jgi:UDP-glucuronate decarboxylase
MPVNLGNPVEFTMLELAETVRAIIGSDVPIIFRPLPQDDPRQRKPDIRRAGEILNWAPTIPLAEGLRPTIAWFAHRLESDQRKNVRVS